jgi:YD repeat-containing protein
LHKFLDTAPSGSGNYLETAQIVRSFNDQNSASNDDIETTKTRADGTGRTIESEDALQRVTTYKYGTNRNLVSVCDPNEVGCNASQYMTLPVSNRRLRRQAVQNALCF